MNKVLGVLLICAVLFGMISCTTDNGTETTAKPVQSQAPDTNETTSTIETTESNTTGETSKTEDSTVTTQPSSLGINMSDLNDLMQPIFSGNTVKNETVMFLEKGDVKTLLYPIDTIISVTSYDGTVVYEEGKDYAIVDGNIKVLENSSIPCITKAQYYNYENDWLYTLHQGVWIPTYCGEDLFDEWQVNVNYTHTTDWNGFKQESHADVFENFIKKLQTGKDVTVIFYGDSITYGHNASWVKDYAPYQYSYPMLFVEALADLFDYTVHYEKANFTNVVKTPRKDYVAGTRGTITYVNTAVAGWTSVQGAANIFNYVTLRAKSHGCDLLVLGFGMNDQKIDTATTKSSVKTIIDSVLEVAPKANIALISTMLPNPLGQKPRSIIWLTGQDKHAGAFKELAQEYVSAGVACGVCDMTSLSQSVLERKEFHDYSGNNINHPNDFFMRVYAQTLLQTVIGYENMD